MIELILNFVLLIFLLFYFSFLFDIFLQGRYGISTSKKAVNYLIELIKKQKPNAKNLYDLGSGWGTVCFAIKKFFPHFKVYGIDKDPLRIIFSKMKAKILREKIYFKKENLLKTNLKNADIVYLYLPDNLMDLLEIKIKKELKPGTLVISNTTKFKNLKPIFKIFTHSEISKNSNFETLFVYLIL
jgi:precorrin-6B methylase 2